MLDFFDANLWTLCTAAVVFGCAIPVVAILTEHQRKSRQAELDNELKRDLLAQGRSPEEIQEVLELSSERGPWWAKKAS